MMQGPAGQDDVDNGIDGPDFVEMHVVDRGSTVDMGFGVREFCEGCDGESSHRSGDILYRLGCFREETTDFGEIANGWRIWG